MGMSMIKTVGSDGTEHNLTPAANFEEAMEMVVPSQYFAMRVFDLFESIKVHGVLDAAPGKVQIHPEVAALIRSENALRVGPSFDLTKAIEEPLAGPVRMVGSIPMLFGEDSMAVDFLTISQVLRQVQQARLSPKGQRLVALAESLEDKSFSSIEVDAAFLSRMARAQERAFESWLGEDQKKEIFSSKANNIQEDVKWVESKIVDIEKEIASMSRYEREKLEKAKEAQAKEREQKMRAMPLLDRARVHLHRVFDSQYEVPTKYDRSCAELLASMSNPKGGSFDQRVLADKKDRREELRARLAEGKKNQEDAISAAEACANAQKTIKASMPSGLSDRIKFIHERALEQVVQRTGMFAYHALPSFHPNGNSPLSGEVDPTSKLHAIMAFAPAISCSTFKPGGGSFSGGAFAERESGAATCVLIGSGVIELAEKSDAGTAPNPDDPSTRGMSSQSAADIDAIIGSRSNQDSYNEVVIAGARPVALFKNLDAMSKYGPISAECVLNHVKGLAERSMAPLPGALPEDPSTTLPILLLAEGKIHRIDPASFATLSAGDLSALPSARTAAAALALVQRVHRTNEVKNMEELGRRAPFLTDSQRLRAAEGLAAIYKQPHARSLLRQARERVGLSRPEADLGHTHLRSRLAS